MHFNWKFPYLKLDKILREGDKNKIRALYKKGMRPSDIAVKLGVPVPTIRHVIHDTTPQEALRPGNSTDIRTVSLFIGDEQTELEEK